MSRRLALAAQVVRAMLLMREMPVKAASRIVGEQDTRLWRLLFHYVTVRWSTCCFVGAGGERLHAPIRAPASHGFGTLLAAADLVDGLVEHLDHVVAVDGQGGVRKVLLDAIAIGEAGYNRWG